MDRELLILLSWHKQNDPFMGTLFSQFGFFDNRIQSFHALFDGVAFCRVKAIFTSRSITWHTKRLSPNDRLAAVF